MSIIFTAIAIIIGIVFLTPVIIMSPLLAFGILVIVIVLFPLFIILSIVGIIGWNTWEPFKFVLFVIIPIYLILLLISNFTNMDPMSKIKEDKKNISKKTQEESKLKEGEKPIAFGSLNKRPNGSIQYEVLPLGELCGINNTHKHLTENECENINSKNMFSVSGNEIYTSDNDPIWKNSYSEKKNPHGCTIKLSKGDDKYSAWDTAEPGFLTHNKASDNHYRFNQKYYSNEYKLANICKKTDTMMMGPISTESQQDIICNNLDPIANEMEQALLQRKMTCEIAYNPVTT